MSELQDRKLKINHGAVSLRKKTFLNCFLENHDLETARSLVGVSKQTIKNWLKNDEDFSKKYFQHKLK